MEETISEPEVIDYAAIYFEKIALSYDSFVTVARLLNTEYRSEDEEKSLTANLEYIASILSRGREYIPETLIPVFEDPTTFDKDDLAWKEYLDSRAVDSTTISVSGTTTDEYRIQQTLGRLTASLDSVLDAKLLELQSAIVDTIMTASLLKEYERKEVLALEARETGDYSVFDILVEDLDITSEDYANMILEKAAIWHAIEDAAILELSKYRSGIANYIMDSDIDNATLELDALRNFDIVAKFLPEETE